MANVPDWLANSGGKWTGALTATLAALLAVQTALYVYLDRLSVACASPDPAARPLVAAVSVLTTLFVLHLSCLPLLLRLPPRRAIAVVLFAALAWRALLLNSVPIQEIDIYRYLWDGATTAQGVNPYRYSPQQVIAAGGGAARPLPPSDERPDGRLSGGAPQMHVPADIRRLLRLRQTQPAMDDILHRIHYPELQTIYPPASQAVFALVHAVTPRGATPWQRVVAMKAAITVFDLATVLLVILLLQTSGCHPAGAILYAWSPLVLKEFANTGHLDAIAVTFTTAALLLLVHRGEAAWRPNRRLLGSAVALSLAVGAKIYPVVLLPIFFAAIAARYTFRQLAGWTMLTAGMSLLVLTPMFWHPVAQLSPTPPQASSASRGVERPMLDAPSDKQRAGHSSWQSPSGLTAFVQHWEMNDFLFMILVENLRPRSTQPEEVWFSVVPDSVRERLVMPVARLTALFKRGPDLPPRDLLAVAFLAVGWLWLLSPTQNPWYWTWAMPMLPFVRNRSWWLLSALATAYYLRFWFQYQFPMSTVFGYRGDAFYDYVVTWILFGSWMLLLCITSCKWCKRHRRR